MNQNISISLRQIKRLTLKAFDENGNDISSLVSWSVVSSDTTVASVGGNITLGYTVTAVKVGVTTVSITASNAAGTFTEADSITVTVAAPTSLSATYA